MNLTLVQCEYHMGKYAVIARINPTNQNKTADFTFARNFCFLVPISRGGKCPFCPPADALSLAEADRTDVQIAWPLECAVRLFNKCLAQAHSNDNTGSRRFYPLRRALEAEYIFASLKAIIYRSFLSGRIQHARNFTHLS